VAENPGLLAVDSNEVSDLNTGAPEAEPKKHKGARPKGSPKPLGSGRRKVLPGLSGKAARA
jgi:hypothetical protein